MKKLLLLLLFLLSPTALAVESYQRPASILPAEIVELEGAVNLLRSPNHEVNAILGDQLGNGEILLLGPTSRAMIRLKDGTRITATHSARLLIRPLEGDRDGEAAELIMLKGRFLIRRPPATGNFPEFRLVSSCGAVRDGGYSWRVLNLSGECLFDGLNVGDPARTPVVAVFNGYNLQPPSGRGIVFQRSSKWHVGP